MYYLLNDPMNALEHPVLGQGDLAGYLNYSRLERDQELLGIDNEVLELCRERTLQNTLGTWEKFNFGILNLPDPDNMLSDRDLIGIYIDENKILVIDLHDRDRSTGVAFINSLRLMSLSRKSNLGRFFALFVKEITKGQYRHFRNFQEEIARLERSVWADEEDEQYFQRNFSRISHQLLLLHSYYEEVVDLLSEMEENENEVLDGEDLGYVRSLLGRMEHYSSNMQFLREYLAQVRETYQAQLDLKLNQIMKIFTVIAAVFLPLSLVVGWYGMNFSNMPELNWKYGYQGVIALSVLITLAILFYFKKRDLL